jgi:hypothetical protein
VQHKTGNYGRLGARTRCGLLRQAVLLGLAMITGALAFGAAPASAASLQIQFSGLNLVYDGTNLFDAEFPNTISSGDPAESDALSTMTFFLDGVQVGSVLTSDIYADVYLADILNIPDGIGFVTSGGNGGTFGFDLLTENSLPGWGLALNVDVMQFFYTGSQIAISVSGLATSLGVQALPFDLEYDPTEPITIVVASAELTNVTTAGGFLTGFNAAGTGNLAGTGFLVPEPTAVVTMTAALVGLVVVANRRRRWEHPRVCVHR